MVKSELLQKLCNLYPNIPRRDLENVTNIVFKEIVNAISSGQRVELRHFGSFAPKIRKARVARNPRTGDKIFIKEKKIPVFKMSKQMRLRLNRNEQENSSNTLEKNTL